MLPSERDPILVVDSNALATRLITFQSLQSIASGNDEILQPRGHIDCLELSLNDSPEVSWNASRGASVSFSKEICRKFIGERLDHDS